MVTDLYERDESYDLVEGVIDARGLAAAQAFVQDLRQTVIGDLSKKRDRRRGAARKGRAPTGGESFGAIAHARLDLIEVTMGVDPARRDNQPGGIDLFCGRSNFAQLHDPAVGHADVHAGHTMAAGDGCISDREIERGLRGHC